MLDRPLDMFITELFLLARNDEEAEQVFRLQEAIERSPVKTEVCRTPITYWDDVPLVVCEERFEQSFCVAEEFIMPLFTLINRFLAQRTRISARFETDLLFGTVEISLTTKY